MKTCSACKTEKNLDEFNKHPTARFGVSNKCRDCAKAYNRKHYSENNEREISKAKKWTQANIDRAREIFRASKKRQRIAHPERKIAENSARVEYVKRATPSWANMFYIREAYHLAKVREQVLGGKWHVDHIIPLRGKLVCGLHVENNLQVIPATVNVRKHAKFDAA